MKKLLLILCLAFLSGCATLNDLQDGLTSLEGVSQEELFATLGYPDGQMQMDEHTVVYVWGREFQSTYALPTTQNTTGYMGTTDFSMQTTGLQFFPVNNMCSIKYIVKDGIASQWEYFGNVGGCKPYIERVKHRVNTDEVGDRKNVSILRKENSLGTQAYPECLKEQAEIQSAAIKDFDALSARIEQICSERTGYKTHNLAKFYAGQALEK